MLTLEATFQDSRSVVRVVSDNPKVIYPCQYELGLAGYSTHIRKGGIRACGS